MKIFKLFSAASTGTHGLINNTAININDPIELNGRTAYRKTYYLRFELDQYANGIRIKPVTSKLSTEFSPYSVHLTPSNETYQVQNWQVEEENDLVKVRLTHPWKLQKVRTNDSRGVDVLRLDGEAPSSEPTVKTNSNITIGDEFIAQDFALRRVGLYDNSELVKTLDEATSAGKGTQKKARAQDVLSVGSNPAHDAVGPGEVGMEDVAIEQVALHGIKSLLLKSYPTGPRITLGTINQPIDEEIQLDTWLMEAGEFTDPLSLAPEETQSFWQQLQTKIDRFIDQVKTDGETITEFYLPLTIESDAPCKFKFTQFEIIYSQLKTEWDHWTDEQKQAGKQVITFDGKTLQSYPLTIGLPPTASIEKAIIKIAADTKGSMGFVADQLSANLNQAQGAMVVQGGSAAKQITLSQAQQVNRLALAVLAVSESVTTTVKIIADQNGTPSGTELATSELTITNNKERHWVIVTLNTTLVLDIAPYWIQLNCNEGSVLWLANSGAGKTIVNSGGKSLIQSVNPLAELGYSHEGQIAESTPTLSIQIDGSSHPIDAEVYDLSDELSGTIPSALNVISSSTSQVNVYSPDIEYS